LSSIIEFPNASPKLGARDRAQLVIVAYETDRFAFSIGIASRA
jgi:hypothetical protein